jgi:co-chaperonin GroES (HSP10)
MTYDELRNINLVPNRVLIQTVDNQSKVMVDGHHAFTIDTQFSEEMHAPVTGIVVNHPKYLIPELMDWHTDMDIMVGDYAVYTYESAIHALTPEHGREFHDEHGNQYLMIDYGDILAIRRDNVVKPINGYLLVEHLLEEHQTAFKLPTLKSMRYGTVAYISPRNKCYFAAGRVRNDTYDFNEDIKVGDLVLFSKFSDVPLEYDAHSSIDKGKKFFRMQRRDILSIINPNEISDVKISLA